MKQRIVKLKNRKGRVDMGIKICKVCGKDYNEKDNLNWSCRQHVSQYSGEMWWCCGKRGADAPGCKFSRHEERKDDEEEEEHNHDNCQHKHRCHCCKQLGHNTDECPRDPNIRSGANPEEETTRIMKQTDFRKVFSDTQVTTTTFLKKCVRVLKLEEKTPMNPLGLAPEVFNEKKEQQENEIFKRGAMSFEDFNYGSVNKYILVDPNFAVEDYE